MCRGLWERCTDDDTAIHTDDERCKEDMPRRVRGSVAQPVMDR